MNILSRLVFAPIGQDSGAESDMDFDALLSGVTGYQYPGQEKLHGFTSFSIFLRR